MTFTGHHSKIELSPEEMLSISQDISRRFAPKASSAEPELFLLPVDPYHLYAYWDIGESHADNHLTLRIYWRPDVNPEVKGSSVWFDVSTDHPESRQNISLPLDDTAYSASLGKLNPDNSFDVLATSNIIHVPPAPGRMKIAPFRNNQEHPPSAPDSQIASISQKLAAHPAGELFEAMSTSPEIKVIRYEKQEDGSPFPKHDWFAKLHFSHSPSHHGDISKIDSELMNLFNERGIGVELIPDHPFIESSNDQYNNASGQGM